MVLLPSFISYAITTRLKINLPICYKDNVPPNTDLPYKNILSKCNTSSLCKYKTFLMCCKYFGMIFTEPFYSTELPQKASCRPHASRQASNNMAAMRQ